MGEELDTGIRETQWTNLDDLARSLQLSETRLAYAKKDVEEQRQAILAILQEGGGHSYHGDFATISVTRRRAVVVDEDLRDRVITEVAHTRSSKYLTHIPEHYELSPLFTEHAREGLFDDIPGIEVRESLGIQVRYQHKGK